MKYRLMVQLAFDSEKEAREVFKALKKLVPKLKPLRDDYFHIHRCTHDDPEGGPCEVIEEWRPSLSRR